MKAQLPVASRIQLIMDRRSQLLLMMSYWKASQLKATNRIRCIRWSRNIRLRVKTCNRGAKTEFKSSNSITSLTSQESRRRRQKKRTILSTRNGRSCRMKELQMTLVRLSVQCLRRIKIVLRSQTTSLASSSLMSKAHARDSSHKNHRSKSSRLLKNCRMKHANWERRSMHRLCRASND